MLGLNYTTPLNLIIPTRPANIYSDINNLPMIDKFWLPPIEQPTVAIADAHSNADAIRSNSGSNVTSINVPSTKNIIAIIKIASAFLIVCSDILRP